MFLYYKIAHLYAFVACHSSRKLFYTQFRPFEKNFRAYESVETNHPASREHPPPPWSSDYECEKKFGDNRGQKSAFKYIILRETVSATEKFNTHYRLY
jgi:hypothetical protein